MFARAALRATSRPVATLNAGKMSRRAYNVDQGASYQVREFFKLNPIPTEAYPLIAITVCMCSFASFHLYKNIHEDRSHLRWMPGQGQVRYEPSKFVRDAGDVMAGFH